MNTYSTEPRPSGAIPAGIPDDDALIRAQAIARRERSEAFLRAIQFGIGSIRRLAR
ncbi:MAG: hypothetical protein HOK54_06080 [Alphaproteobacteria bacterium]|jgi:hypothetical protein|nr:hypothetical protein [Alphaproteobacteria bacterium]